MDLRDHMDDPTPQWSLCPLVVEDGISILFGDGGVGKSNIALAVLLALETGNERVLGLTPVTRHKGLYMDWEANAQSHAKRYRRLTKGLGIAPVKLRYMRCDSPLHEMRQAVKRRVAEEGISFIIIDSAAAACGGEPEKAAMALQLCNAIRFVGVTALIIAHQTKDAMASRKPFGSVFWNNVARSTVEVINQQEPGEDAIHVGLFHRKVNDGRLERPFGRTILFTPESITIVAENLSENPELSKKLSNWMRIQAIMRGKMTNAEIAEASGVNLNSVAATMRRAQHQGLVDELADGRWFLVSRREEGQ